MRLDLEDINKGVLEVIINIKGIEEVDYDQDFLEIAFFDSFDIMNLIIGLEKKFNIEIDPDDILPENLKSVSAISHLVKISDSK